MTLRAEDTRVQREAVFWLSLIELNEPSEADTSRFSQPQRQQPP